jgi:dienelactone hydrolase
MTLVLMGFYLNAHAEIVEKAIEYKDGDVALQGFLFYDNTNPNPRSGILVVHEWWGLNDYAKMRARQLAELGYVTFAADIYGKGKTASTPEKARELAGPFYASPDMFRKRVQAALDVLEAQPLVKGQKLAAIGYCFGGSAVLELARSGAELDAVASFHGGLSTGKPATTGNVKPKLLIMTGADDSYVPPEQVMAFEKEMKDAGADFQIIIYSGAVHAFTNPAAGNDPTKGIAYNAVTDRRSWAAMKLFFEMVLK